MENNVCTSLAQSRKLTELGVSEDTADMHYAFSAIGGNAFQKMIDNRAILLIGNTNSIYPYQPAWSLSALLEILPYTVITDKGDEYTLQMYKEDDVTYVFGYNHAYTDTVTIEFMHQEPINAAYDLIVWLIENNYIEVNNK